jgi:hypothetical protein
MVDASGRILRYPSFSALYDSKQAAVMHPPFRAFFEIRRKVKL